MRLMITRAMPDAARTDSLLRDMGHDVVLAPLLQIENLDQAVIPNGPFSAVLMTSANAARALAIHPARAALLQLPVFAVGAHTADAAFALGFPDVIAGPGDAQDLIPLIKRHEGEQISSLLYLVGEDRARDIDGELQPHGIAVQMVILYRARAAASLPPTAVTALTTDEVDGVLHYSARTSAIFVECARKANLLAHAGKVAHYCMSQRVAKPLHQAGFERIHVAKTLSEESLLALLPNPRARHSQP